MKWKKMALPLALSMLPFATGAAVPQDSCVLLTVCEAKATVDAEAPGVARRAPFDANWRFCLGDLAHPEIPSFDDSGWRTLDVPHDWSIEFPFDRKSPAGSGGGFLNGGVGWYRKSFTLPDVGDKKVLIDFDGVYINSKVYINGHLLGDHPYGYTSFQYDLTPYLFASGTPNVLAVRVENDQSTSRWYSGTGIERNVWLQTLAPIHVAQWGTFVTTPTLSEKIYDEDHAKHPNWKIFGSETSSAIRSRGVYHLPTDVLKPTLDHFDELKKDDRQCSSYDNTVVPWGDTAEKTWIDDRDRPFAFGQFIWTGFDYIGEPTPYDTSKSSYFGIVDTCGFPKDIYYFYKSQWTDAPLVHILPSWEQDRWQAGETVPVWAYTNAASVELYLNGKSLGTQKYDPNGDTLHLAWDVPYEPGELKAVARDANGKEIAKDVIRTLTGAASIRLTADAKSVKDDGKDLVYITADIVDDDGDPSAVCVPGTSSRRRRIRVWPRRTVFSVRQEWPGRRSLEPRRRHGIGASL